MKISEHNNTLERKEKKAHIYQQANTTKFIKRWAITAPSQNVQR